MEYDLTRLVYQEDRLEALREKYDEVEVFLSLYPGIPFSTTTSSPFRKDDYPSFIISDKYGPVLYKDFGTGESGHLVDFIKRMEGLDTYYECYLFIDNVMEGDTRVDPGVVQKSKELSKAPKIAVKYREWNTTDRSYWKRVYISSRTLRRYHVRPVSHIFINDYCFPADPLAYAYHEYKDSILTLKIYQPYDKEHKWMSTHDSSVWQGWDQALDKGSDGFILTKSLKDIMFLDQHTDLAISSLQNEGILPKRHVIQHMTSRYPRRYILYDNDMQGVKASYRFMEELGRELGFQQIFIPASCGKDITEMVVNKGLEYTLEFLKDGTT